ncbi:MAG: pantoate--beta-alanine ligase [Thermoanaerobacteraceae bacterium]|nr:pantoate--beta-alanine ligase [Thermoanaerobacteraceae bacterium]
MECIKTINEVRSIVRKAKKEGKRIGLVPTMGYLHEGHLSLMRMAREKSDFVAVSIFVNPIQFGPNEDYESYPRNMKRDLRLCEDVGIDVVFAPEVPEMYPEELLTHVVVEKITDNLCGTFRPGHFTGVATVVSKLFNIIQPDIAVFGQKDYQQLVVIKRMVRDLNIPVEVIGAPTVREEDGLARSSRNSYLSYEERKVAPVLYQSLLKAKGMLDKGERNPDNIKKVMEVMISSKPYTSIQYISIANPCTLEDLEVIKDKALVALAVYVGKTRLIDNILWGYEDA